MAENRGCFAMGDEAFAKGAIAAGARFYAGYPITPSTEIAETASVELPKVGGMYVQMEDEIGSMACIIGASCSGVKAFTATSGPGFSLMQEPLGIAIHGEVPCVIVDVQRNGPGTAVGTKPAQGDLMQTRYGTHGDHEMIVLSPASVQECYDLALVAFNYAEKYRTPVIFLMDGEIGHLHETFVAHEFPAEQIFTRVKPTCKKEEFLSYDLTTGNVVPPMPAFGDGYIQHITGTGHDMKGRTSITPENTRMFDAHFMDKIRDHRDEIAITKEFMAEDAEYLIVTFGCSVRGALAAAKEARAKGIRAGVIQLVTVWPMPDLKIDPAKIKAVFVPEMNMGQLGGEIEKMVRYQIPVVKINKVNTETIKPHEILQKMEEVIQ